MVFRMNDPIWGSPSRKPAQKMEQDDEIVSSDRIDVLRSEH